MGACLLCALMLPFFFGFNYVAGARVILKQGFRSCQQVIGGFWSGYPKSSSTTTTGSQQSLMAIEEEDAAAAAAAVDASLNAATMNQLCRHPWTSQTQEEEQDMDREIWEKLPHDLIIKVLAWLPPPFVVRMRTVCKAWNSLSFSADDVSRLPPREPWLLVCNYSSSPSSQTVSAFDPGAQKWYTGIPLTFDGLRASNIQVCTCAGGFLLCRSSEHVLYTCNPLTKSWRKLPPCLAPIGGFTFEGFEMDFDAATGKFQIYHDLCQYDETDRCDRMSELYDSESDCWKPFGAIAAHDGELPEKIAFLNRVLYCVAFLAPVSLRRYKLQNQAWSEIPLPALKAPIYRIITVNLVECHARLLLVAAILEGGDCRKSLRVWELVEEEEQEEKEEKESSAATAAKMMKWVDLEIKPNQDSEALLEMDFAKYSCVGRGNSFSVFSIKASEDGKALACDLKNKSWHWISLCPGIEPLRLTDIIGSRRVIWGTGIKQFLAYQPTLLHVQ